MAPVPSSDRTDPVQADQETTSLLGRLNSELVEHGLLMMGALHPAKVQARDLTGGTLILVGCGPGFWQVFNRAPEAHDGQRDPVDRWSSRVITSLSNRYDATPYFPFGGPPYTPFIDWAQKSKRAHSSPTGMLVHDTVGLMISYRGALHFSAELPLPRNKAQNPCGTCTARPCAAACPVGALSETQAYDVAACHAYLDTEAGQDCLSNGCAARRACPISAGANRTPEQSALHMKAFHPK